MKIKPDTCTCVFGANVCIGYLEAFSQEIKGVRQDEDIEHIHRMRVASRRLRSALPLFKNCFLNRAVSEWIKQIRKITSALGTARDLDVQIDCLEKIIHELPAEEYYSGVDRLQMRLKQKRGKNQSVVIHALDSIQGSGVINEMLSMFKELIEQKDHSYPYTHTVYKLASEAIVKRISRFLSYDEKIKNPKLTKELHAMRIEAKRLRYTLETFPSLYVDKLKNPIKIMRNIQEILGNIQDCDVWLEYLPEFIEKESERTVKYYDDDQIFKQLAPGILYFQWERQQERKRLYFMFLKEWQKWREQHIWRNLCETVMRPILPEDQVYPLTSRPDGSETQEVEVEDTE